MLHHRQPDFACCIPGLATPQLRPRIVNKGTHRGLADVGKVTQYKADVRKAFSDCKTEPPYDGPVALEIQVHVLKPASWSKRRTEAATKPDADNFAKLICDCAEGLLYTNDSRVVTLLVTKHLSVDPRVEVMMWKLTE